MSVEVGDSRDRRQPDFDHMQPPSMLDTKWQEGRIAAIAVSASCDLLPGLINSPDDHHACSADHSITPTTPATTTVDKAVETDCTNNSTPQHELNTTRHSAKKFITLPIELLNDPRTVDILRESLLAESETSSPADLADDSNSKEEFFIKKCGFEDFASASSVQKGELSHINDGHFDTREIRVISGKERQRHVFIKKVISTALNLIT